MFTFISNEKTTIAVQLIYNIVLVSGVQHSDPNFLQIILHLKLLQKKSYIPFAVPYILTAYLFYTQ